MNEKPQWIDESAAINAARQQVGTVESPDRVAIQLALNCSQPGAPLLVHRLDRPDEAYYLIPWIGSTGMTLLVRLDATSGCLLGTVFYPDPVSPGFLSADQALRKSGLNMGSPNGGLLRAVWCPCRQSTSPNRPFFEVPCADGIGYLDQSGTIHDVLEVDGRGGGDNSAPTM